MMDRDKMGRILIRGTNWIGDALLTTPAITAIRRGFPKARITLLVIPSVAPVFEGNPDVDEILIYDRRGRHRGLIGRYRLARELRSRRFDLAILLQNAMDAALLTFAAGIPYRYGYDTDGRGLLLHPSVLLLPETGKKHQAAYYLDLLKPLLGDTDSFKSADVSPALRLVITEAERMRVADACRDMGIGPDDRLIGCHPGAAYGTAKRWPPGRFAETARILVERHNAKILLFAGPGEEDVAEEVARRVGEGIFNLGGKTTLREAMAWIARCRILLTNDSGPMHIAAALGVPVVAVFGSTDPVTTGPYGPGHRIIRRETSCSPCLLRECPTDHQCMEGVMVEDVLEGVLKTLSVGYRPGGGKTSASPDPCRVPSNIRSAVFLDRDGTLNEELGYVDSPERFHLLPGVGPAVARLNEAGIPVFLLTNQSGVGRGYFSQDRLDAIHRTLEEGLAREGAHLDDILICPHHPEAKCRCRKPGTGLLTRAALAHGIDLSRSYVVGDKGTDMETARRGGAQGILVMTGYGAEEHRRIEEVPRQRPDYTAVHLSDAVDRILSEQGRGKAEGAGHRILLIKPSSLGDIIHGLPVLRALREKWPSARISWVVKEQWADILRGHPMIDELILLRPDSLTRGLRAFRKRLRQGEYDLAVDLQGLFRSGLIAGLSGAKTRLGFGNAREGAPLFYTHRVTVAKELHAVDRNLALAASLLGRNSNPRVDHFTPNLFPLYVGPETYRRMIQRLTDILPPRGGSGAGMGSPRIALFPGGRWDKKRWPADGFTRLGLHLNRELNARIILLGSGQEGRLIQSVGDGLKDAAALTDLNLREMAALLSEMDLVITNDSGPMHIASAVGTPVVALFGPTDPGRTGPYGSMNRVVRFEMPCSPCFRRPCIHPRFLCMESITVEEVMDGAKKMLQGR